MIEMQGDDLEELFDVEGDNVDFDMKEKSRLDMLERYRSNLVAGARSDSSHGAIDDDEEDELRL
eukprot:CAMPEP_0185018986 /NCGR_PEP_ID=MMETSP1103-20130426/1627_1 /TAXON_ID=36769 /ORGANISM="Paraphysomonas bandaiensis, Strain Caron Lab Isolate" /LENGTH=63 /DNA_ID=CAMNT_0027549047 /DNA_START=292 /DNA_END=483 /DNA_ORIENTATION=-